MRGRRVLKWIEWALLALCLSVLAYCAKKGSLDATLSPGDEVVVVKLSSTSETVARGGEAALTVRVMDVHSQPVADREVTFSATLGTMPDSAATDENGLAVVTFRAGTVTGTSVVTARVGEYQGSISLRVTDIPSDGAIGGYQYALSSDVESLLANGMDRAEIREVVTGTDGQPKEGVRVTFSTTVGTLSPSVAVTDAQGAAVSTLVSSASRTDTVAHVTATLDTSSVGKVVVREARSSGETKSDPAVPSLRKTAESPAALLLIPFRGVTLEVVPEREVMSVDGESLPVMVTLKETTSHTPLVDVPLRFGATLGTIIGTATTDGSGVARNVLVSGNKTGTDSLTVFYGPKIKKMVEVRVVEMVPTGIRVMSEPTSIQANGKSTSTITVLLRDPSNNPISDRTVQFSSTLGTVDALAVTDENGQAVARFTSERRNGIAVVTARYESLEDSTVILLSGVVLEMRANPEHLIADGATGSVVTGSLKDAAGTPISGETVRFSTDLGLLNQSAEDAVGITDVYGTATATLTSEASGTAIVRAEGAGAAGTAEASFTDYLLSVSAEPVSIAANESAVLRLKLLDNNGQPVAGIPVTFSTTLGQIEGSGGTTDASGRAETTLTSTQSGTALITAVAETERGKVSSTMEIPISSASPAKILLQVDPSIIAVDGGAAEVTAIVTDEQGNPVADALVGFTFDGARGGAYLDPGTALTNANGVAKTVFSSGSLASSKLGDVSFEARIEGTGVISDRVHITISGAPANLTVGYTPSPSSNNDGTFDIPIAALVADINGNPAVDGTLVNFGVDKNVGVIQSPITTNKGRATTQFTYPESAAGDTVEVRCQSGSVSDVLLVMLPGSSGTVARVALSASSMSILGNGMDDTNIQALVTDTHGNPVGDVMVTFASTEGRIKESAITEPQFVDKYYGTMNLNWGIAQVPLTSSAVGEDLIAYVQASVGDKESTPLEIVFRGITLTLVPEEEEVGAGGEGLPVTAVLKETTSHTPLTGVPLHFGTSSGTIVGTTTTDESGVARNVLVSGSETGTARLTVFYGPAIKTTVEVQIVEMVASGIQIMADPTSIQANGTSTSTITVLLRDLNNNPILDRAVRFSTTLGTVDAEAVTDANGRAVAHLVSERRNGTAVVTARYETLETTAEVGFMGIALDVWAEPEDLIADGATASVIRATLKDAAGLPIVGETVRFSVVGTLGTLKAGEGETDVTGVVTDALTSSKSGEVVVRVTGAGAEGTITVRFTDYLFSLEADTTFSATVESSTITATLLDNTGAPMQGARVDFSTTLGWLSPSTGSTDAAGKVQTILTGTGAGTATVVAMAVIGEGETVSRTIDVDILSALPAAITLVGSPTIVAVDGGTSSITAVVTDAEQNPVSGAIVSFTIAMGPHGGEVLSPATVTTDFRGVASTNFQSGFKPSTSFKDVKIIANVVGTSVESDSLALTIAGAPQRVTTGYACPPEDNEDGTYSLAVAAIVADINGNPVVDGTLVYFGTTPSTGVISSPMGTVEGIARTTLVYPANNAGSRISILAESRGISGSIDPIGGVSDAVELILPGSSGEVAAVRVSVTPARILGDGVTTAELSAVVTDALDNPVGWIAVEFFAEHGTIVQGEGVTGHTVGWSKAWATLTSAPTEAKEGLVDSVWAVVGTRVSRKMPVIYVGISMEVSVDAAVIAAGGEQTTVTVMLKEAETTVPIEGAEVAFGTSLGSIVGTATTDASGVARSTLISGDVSGTTTVTVAYGPGIQRTVPVVIAPVRGEDPASIVLVSAQPAIIGVKGSGDNETAAIVFEVTDAYGIKVRDDTPILFTLTGGITGLDASLSPDTARTVDGRASATLQSGTRAGTVKIVATSADFPQVSSGAVSVAVHGGPPDADHFSLAADQLNIAGKRFSGLEDFITAYVFDQYSNPVPVGTSISFRTTGGGIEGSAVTDKDGRATVKLISAKPWPEDGFVTVTAQTVGRDGPIEATIQVLFSGPTAPILVDPPYITVPDGGRQAFIFFVGDGSGNPLVAGTTIEVTATGGSVTGDVDVTFSDTQCQESTLYGFIFEDEEGDDVFPQVKIEVTSQNGDRETAITAGLPSPLSVQLTADRRTVWADGASTVALTAAVVDMAGYPISGQAVTFTSDVGSVPSFAATDAEGRAEVVWTSIPSATDLSTPVIARMGALADTLTVTLQGVTLTVDTAHPTLLADGVSTVEVIAQYAETATNAPIVGQTIRFIAFDDLDGDGVQDAGEESIGMIAPSGVTNESGRAKGTFTGEASAEDREVRIRAAVAGLSATTSVQLQRVTLTRDMALLVTPTLLVADGQSTSNITVTVTQNGYPVPDGTVIRFRLIPQMGTLGSGEAISTVRGIVRNTLTSSYTPETVTLRAWVQGDSSATVRETEITYLVGSAATVTVSADLSELPADGITSTMVTATVKDAVGNPVSNVEVAFTSNIGNVTASASTNTNGEATAQFSSDITGTAIVTATVAGTSGNSSPIFVHPGPPHSILLSCNPTFVGVRGVGRNATLTVTAKVRDSHGNVVADETEVEFSIYASPSGLGDTYQDELSTTDPVPTVNGIAQVSFTSGSRAGTARIRARVDAENIEAVSTEFQIFSGPPYIEQADNPFPDPYQASSHLAIGAGPINILGWNRVYSLTTITVVAGDRYNNPVPEGTAVYFTTTGGVAATARGYVDEDGMAAITLITSAPFPTVDRYHGLLNPNTGIAIPGDPQDFDGDGNPNDGIARVLATSEGVDENGNSAMTWSVCDVVFSGTVAEFSFTKNTSVDTLWIGDLAGMTIRIRDINGNPIVPESVLTAGTTAGVLSWDTWKTGDPGQIEYSLSVGNDLAPKESPTDETEYKPALVTVKLVDSRNGVGGATLGFVLVNEER